MKSSLMHKIRNGLSVDKQVSVRIYDDNCIEILLWEREFPITVLLKEKRVFFDTEVLPDVFHLDSEMLAEIVLIMKFIEGSFEEMREWVENDD